MPEVETISWKVLFGNKFAKSLDAAMLSKAGYVKSSVTRHIGDFSKSYFTVKYDREYVIEYIRRLICRPFFHLGKKRVVSLVEEAWDNWYANSLTATDRMASNK